MKEDEKKFFITCIKYNLSNPYAYSIRDIINFLSEFINYKRCWYLLRKWVNKGFYNYGTVEDLGWFETDKLTGEYLKIYNKLAQNNEV